MWSQHTIIQLSPMQRQIFNFYDLKNGKNVSYI